MDLDKLQKELAEDEGCKYEVYLDHIGYKTFGIGHLCKATDPENDMDVGTEVSKETMRKPGSKGAPTANNFKRAAKTAKKKK